MEALLRIWELKFFGIDGSIRGDHLSGGGLFIGNLNEVHGSLWI